MKLDIEPILIGRTLLDEKRLALLRQTAVQQAALNEGDFIECGVYQGGTAGFLAHSLEVAGSDYRLHLLDAWQGLPQPSPEDGRPRIEAGTFNDTSVEDVRGLLGLLDLESKCVFHPGWFSDTLPGLAGPFAFAHIDCDYYAPVKECLLHLLPRMTYSGVLIVDDYGDAETANFPGVRKAVTEALALFPNWNIVECVGERDQAVKICRS